MGHLLLLEISFNLSKFMPYIQYKIDQTAILIGARISAVHS